MPKRKTPTIPNKCPFCGARFNFDEPHRKTTKEGTIRADFVCGGHILQYQVPGGWRLDIFECREKEHHQKEPKQTPERWLFTDQEGGI